MYVRHASSRWTFTELIVFECNSILVRSIDSIHDLGLTLVRESSNSVAMIYLGWAPCNLNISVWNVNLTVISSNCVFHVSIVLVLNWESLSSFVLLKWECSSVSVTKFIFPHFLSADFAVISCNHSSGNIATWLAHGCPFDGRMLSHWWGDEVLLSCAGWVPWHYSRRRSWNGHTSVSRNWSCRGHMDMRWLRCMDNCFLNGTSAFRACDSGPVVSVSVRTVWSYDVLVARMVGLFFDDVRAKPSDLVTAAHTHIGVISGTSHSWHSSGVLWILHSLRSLVWDVSLWCCIWSNSPAVTSCWWSTAGAHLKLVHAGVDQRQIVDSAIRVNINFQFSVDVLFFAVVSDDCGSHGAIQSFVIGVVLETQSNDLITFVVSI